MSVINKIRVNNVDYDLTTQNVVIDSTEKVIGTWFGKPLYSKTLNVGTISTGSGDIALSTYGITNADVIMIDLSNSYLAWAGSPGTNYQPVLNYYASNDYFSMWATNNDRISYMFKGTRDVVLTLHYTKTTDPTPNNS